MISPFDICHFVCKLMFFSFTIVFVCLPGVYILAYSNKSKGLEMGKGKEGGKKGKKRKFKENIDFGSTK